MSKYLSFKETFFGAYPESKLVLRKKYMSWRGDFFPQCSKRFCAKPFCFLNSSMVAQIMNAENSLELDEEMILKALDTYPDLPLLLQDSGLERAAKQFSNQNLVSKIPCKVYVISASNIQFVNKLPTSILRSFSMNSHYWQCLPVSVIRKMMRESNVGQKLEVHELMMAAKVIEKSKR